MIASRPLHTSDRVVGRHQLVNSNNVVNVAATGMMHSSRLLPLLVVAVAVASLGAARAEADRPRLPDMNYTCSAGKYTDDSPYGKNLLELLSTLASPDPTTVDNWWFSSRTVGTGPDQVSGLAMCYAYSTPESCLNCLADVYVVEYEYPEWCFNSRNVSLLTSDGCIIRFADAPFFGSASADSGARLVLRSDYMFAGDAASMREARHGLLSQLAEMAGADGALRFATGSQGYVDAVIGLRHVIYGVAQCTRDLPLSECTSCLQDLLTAMYDITNSTSASVVGFSCYLSYQLDKPINIATMPPTPSPAPTTAGSPTGSSAPPPPIDGRRTLFAAVAAAAGVLTLFNVGV